MLIRATLAMLLAASPSLAQTAPLRVTYAVYAHGFNVAAIQASIAVSPSNYRLQVSYRLSGLIGLVMSGDATTTAEGRFATGAVLPTEMFSVSHARGVTRVTQLNWQDGHPVTMQLFPPIGTEREPVPPADQAGTIDTLSAMAGLLRQIAATGRCEASQKTFDGRRLSLFTARTVGEEALEATSRSSFESGMALRCDFDGRQIGGFAHDEDPRVKGKPNDGTAWFARLKPGEPLIPVRIAFDSPSVGRATMYVTADE